MLYWLLYILLLYFFFFCGHQQHQPPTDLEKFQVLPSVYDMSSIAKMMICFQLFSMCVGLAVLKASSCTKWTLQFSWHLYFWIATAVKVCAFSVLWFVVVASCSGIWKVWQISYSFFFKVGWMTVNRLDNMSSIPVRGSPRNMVSFWNFYCG